MTIMGYQTPALIYNSELDSRPRSQMEQARKIKIKTEQKVPSMTLEARSAETPVPAAAEVQMFEMAAPDAEVMMQDEDPMGWAHLLNPGGLVPSYGCNSVSSYWQRVKPMNWR